MVTNHGDDYQQNRLYLHNSNNEESEFDGYIFEQFQCDTAEELVKIGEQI